MHSPFLTAFCFYSTLFGLKIFIFCFRLANKFTIPLNCGEQNYKKAKRHGFAISARIYFQFLERAIIHYGCAF